MNHVRTLIGNFTRHTPTLLNSPQHFQHGHKQLIIDLHCHNKKLYSNIVITKFNKFIIHDNSYLNYTIILLNTELWEKKNHTETQYNSNSNTNNHIYVNIVSLMTDSIQINVSEKKVRRD
ncbi:hypothetical protein V8G54_024503 [Vigna mungo]|uniref:Uncharacterized protein n=1 Tax=Vigna mungo TaxID=3915 RepID=A0AAQ3N730_VIGMU